MSPLSQPAMDVIHLYLALPFGRTTTISCPYLNNRRKSLRAGLRVCIGKGTPEEIVQEAELMALREKIKLNDLSDDDLKTFLVQHNLGIDCSGFAYHVLDAETRSRKGKSLRHFFRFPYARNPLRALLALLRPVENAGTRTFAHESNSLKITVSDAAPGDFVVMLDMANVGNPNHILVIQKIDQKGDKTTLHYIHSIEWSTDGEARHGVRPGIIEILDPSTSLLDGQWVEQKKTGEKNETWQRAKKSKVCTLRRLRCLAA